MIIKYLSDITIAPTKYPEDAYMETPPAIYKFNEEQFCIVSTSWAVNTQINKGKNILLDEEALAKEGKRCSWGNYFDYDKLLLPEEVNPYPFWKLNYYGVMDAATYSYEGHNYLLGIMHAENKNERINGNYYKNSVKSPDTEYTSDEYSGNCENGEYNDNFDNYFAFLGITYIELGAEPIENLTNNDIGPVIWPDEPYLDKNEKKISGGLRHPSVIINNDYIYIYYIDESPNNYGHRVARAKLSHPNELVFYKLSNTGFDFAALPYNFNKADKLNLKIGTGYSKKLNFNNSLIRFSAAKVKNEDKFLGVAEFISNGAVWTELFLSKDLINWDSIGKIEGAQSDRWYEGVLHYPIFCDEFCTNTKEIDNNCFYIVGTYHCNQVKPVLQYVKLSLEI